MVNTTAMLQGFIERGLAASKAAAELGTAPPQRDPTDLATMKTALACLARAREIRDDARIRFDQDEPAAAAELELQARRLLRDAIDVTLVIR